MSRPVAGEGADPSPERQLEIAHYLLARARRKLNFYRVLTCGLLVVSCLALLWGVGRTIVMGGFMLVGNWTRGERLIALGVDAWARFVDLFSTPLRDVPLGVAIIIALLLIGIAAHWMRSDQ